MQNLDTSTPVLLLGGRENSLGIARHLGGLGINIKVSGESGCVAMDSRFCKSSYPVPSGISSHDFWDQLLLPGDQSLYGHIILACNDPALEYIASRKELLAGHYLLDDAQPSQQTLLLDKQETLRLAKEVGIGAPDFWEIKKEADLDPLHGKLHYPVMVKPLQSHKFARVFGRKLFIIEQGFEDLCAKVRLCLKNNLEVMVVDMIPGPDDLLSSYYTYMDSQNRPLFHLTKRVIRRYPVNRGGGCYHATEWLPETAKAGLKFFQGIGFTGLGNVEFKRDTRDGELKIIEVNTRLTAAHALLVNAGAPIDLIVYCHLTDQEPPTFEHYEQDRRLWYPVRDFMAYRELRARGELSFGRWLRSICHQRIDLPFWRFDDPLPSLALGKRLIKRTRRLTRPQQKAKA